jgi:hypothetical protein
MHLETKYPSGGEDSGVDRLVLESDLGGVVGLDKDNNSIVAGSHLVVDFPGEAAKMVDVREPQELSEVLNQKDDHTFAINEQAIIAYIAERKGRFLHFLGVIKLGWVREVPNRAKIQPVRPFDDPDVMN